MNHIVSHTFELDRTDQLLVTDHGPTYPQVTLHNCGFPNGALTLYPEHMPALVDAVAALMQYATNEQVRAIESKMTDLLKSIEPDVEPLDCVEEGLLFAGNEAEEAYQ